MQVPVVWKTYTDEVPNTGYWDQHFLHRAIDGQLWQPAGAHEFVNYDDYPPDMEYGIVIIPGQVHGRYIDEINADLAKLEWCVVIITSDEEWQFPLAELKHPRMMIYGQSPHMGETSRLDRFLPIGAPPQAYTHTSKRDKVFNWFFAGQITHRRREECYAATHSIWRGLRGSAYPTDGFAKGLPPERYYELLNQSQVIPCPSGPLSPESFRFYEALEAGCVPVLDDCKPSDDSSRRTGYWEDFFFNEKLPFPVLFNWSDLPGWVEHIASSWPQVGNLTSAWWMKYKREFIYNLHKDISYLSGFDPEPLTLRDKITVLVSTSPISCHPDTRILDETIDSIRSQLPDCEIIIMCDGVRGEQEHRRADYLEYVSRLVWKCQHKWHNVLPIVFDVHLHQAVATKRALEFVRTPTILFVEHDTPLCGEVDWDATYHLISSREVNVLRFHFEAFIPEVHDYLMLDHAPITMAGLPVVRTFQWSQRPHLASVDFYKRILRDNFPDTSRTMIEDKFYSVIENSMKRGMAGWNDFKVAIYHPDGSIKRNYHTDGRASEEKYGMLFE